MRGVEHPHAVEWPRRGTEGLRLAVPDLLDVKSRAVGEIYALRVREPLLRRTNDGAGQLVLGQRLFELMRWPVAHRFGDAGGRVGRAQQADEILRDRAAIGVAQQVDQPLVGGLEDVLVAGPAADVKVLPILPAVSLSAPVPVTLVVPVSLPVPIPVPVPVPFMVSVVVVVVESDEPLVLAELLQLTAANAITAINNTRLMVLVFIFN